MKHLLIKKWLEKNASKKSYVRGVKIFEDDWAVRIFESAPARLRAEVMGTRFYVVAFQIKRDKLDAACTCPAFRDFDGLCKHIVAAGFHAIEAGFKKEPKPLQAQSRGMLLG